jgi:membrane associated rhomboid family serine protease
VLFPISDDDRQVTSPAFVTNVIFALNVGMFLIQMNNPSFTYGWSVIPKEITTGVDFVEPIQVELPNNQIAEIPQAPGPPIIYLTLLTAMFMHGGFGHIAGNMLYLWIFGNNVEHRFGHWWFLLFYLSAGLVSSLAQIAVGPNSVIPNLGASGAIAGVMGAYIVLFPHNRVNAVFFYNVITVPAIVVLGMWIAMQFVSGYGSIAATSSSTGGVAYMAHIGGFITGVLVALMSRAFIGEEQDSVLRRQYERDPRAHPLWPATRHFD